jgi:prophage DNA circulation protein
MAWRDSLITAKFRNKPFLYEKVDGEIGRRTILKEYPGNKKKNRGPRVEDNGPASRKFVIEMFFIGPDYQIERDAMREALETAGPGQLDHPYWGVMQVTAHGTARFTESTKEGGMCKVSVTFIEQGDELVLERADTVSAVLSAADKLDAAAETAFAAVASVEDAIESVIDDFVGAIETVASAINTVRGKIAAVMQVFDDAAAAITEVTDEVAALVLTPTVLATKLKNMVVTVVAGVNHISDAYTDVIEFFGGEDALPNEGSVIAKRTQVDSLLTAASNLASITDDVEDGPAGDAQQATIKRQNRAALVQLMKASAITSVSRTAVELTFESYDQAQQLREVVSELVDDLLTDEDLPDEMYTHVVSLRAALTDHLAVVAAELPELRDFTPGAPLPSLVLAYQLYGDVSREADLLTLNIDIKDPTIIPAGQSIRVLSDE